MDRRADTRVDIAAAAYKTPAITAREFTLFQQLIQRESGIHLDPGKKALLVGRLAARLRALGVESFGAYYLRVLEDGKELTELIDRISTNETAFFREPGQFEFLTEVVFPKWLTEADAGQRPRHVRAWSAGCSTGEEPYSLAMVLLDHFPPALGWKLEILATDLSTTALKQAQEAIWPGERAEKVPPRFLKRFMLRGTGTQEGRMKAGPELRSLVSFRHLNLAGRSYDVRGLFELILCRNVLIYFDPRSKLRVTDLLLDHLAPKGFLLVGHSESLSGVTDRVKGVVPAIYRLATEGDRQKGERGGGAEATGDFARFGGRK